MGTKATEEAGLEREAIFILCKMNNFEVLSILRAKKVRRPNLLKDLWISVSLNEWKDPDNLESKKRGSILLEEL